MKNFTVEEVELHNKPNDLWVIIDAKVYDLSKFANIHPGGSWALFDEDVAGKDATEAFYSLHRHEVLEKPQYKRLQIGTIQGEKSSIVGRVPGALSTVPYAEPTWLSEGYHSPYFTEKHREFQRVTRQFVDKEIYEDAQARELDGKPPSKSVLKKLSESNFLAMFMGPGPHLKGRTLFDGLISPEEFTPLHELIMAQEVGRINARGYIDGLFGAKVISLPTVLHFCKNEELRTRVVEGVLSHEKITCLAITEAYAGSDVMGMKTNAVKTEDGKSWIINGTKKWITNGVYADYFIVGCKTESGFTVILVERERGGIDTRLIKTSYSTTAGTSFITFENVKVPVENTLGEEGGGLFVILSNFNHERWGMCCFAVRAQRTVVEECFKWINQRKAFGKPLVRQAVIRHKLAKMIAQVESEQAWLESITYQMCNMTYKQQADLLAGQIALLKSFITNNGEEIASDAQQIFGGRALTQTGMGRVIEHFHRTVEFDAVLGGAADVMADLGVRQAVRSMPINARL
ncbi:acyl-CoA dehydrogenase [Flagelloscypha sp. PMI_526]|nr:acyl-CoA dehydrogenase [Flagelloscypha sp. PMI_526]